MSDIQHPLPNPLPQARERGLSPAIDREAVKRQMGALDAGTIEMLGMFISMTRPQIDKLRAAFAAQDRAQVKEIAHSLKGAARSACCMALGDAAAEIQTACEKGALPPEPLIAAVEAEFVRAEEEIKGMKA